MRRNKKNILSFILIFVIIFGNIIPSFAVGAKQLDSIIKESVMYIYNTVPKPHIGSIGGEWAVLGLARSGHEIPEKYYQDYYKKVEEYVIEHDGSLHEKKYTEYSRVILALTSIGKDPRNVGGYNLLKPLGDYEKTVWQGINGPIWALIALDSDDYEIPINEKAKIQATREMYINYILDYQLDDGGWSLLGKVNKNDTSDADITGMALQALSKYQDNPEVKKAIDKALDCMSKKQTEKAGYISWETENSESCVQMIVALSELGIPLNDKRFVKNGKTMLDNLLTFYVPGGSFKHKLDGEGSSQMSTEQALYGLVAAKRLRDNESSLYTMDDVIDISETEKGTEDFGLPNKHKNIKYMPIKNKNISLKDIEGNRYKNSIEQLVLRDIINGKTQEKYEPNENMTRAEFATIVVRSLGLNPSKNNKFKDVKDNAWYSDYVGTATDYNIVNGISKDLFNPEGFITREEASVMIVRAGKLIGLDTNLSNVEIRDELAGFSDYIKISNWAKESMAYSYREEILDGKVIEVKPEENVKRDEIANMIYKLLELGKLL